MTMDVFGFSKDDFIDGVEIGGAATFLEFAAKPTSSCSSDHFGQCSLSIRG